MKETLYQLDQNGNTKVWTITVTNNTSFSTVTVESGRLGGNLITNSSDIKEGKNAGKSNETNHYEQAVSEAKSKVEEKLRRVMFEI